VLQKGRPHLNREIVERVRQTWTGTVKSSKATPAFDEPFRESAKMVITRSSRAEKIETRRREDDRGME
jgi:hypothetical protein